MALPSLFHTLEPSIDDFPTDTHAIEGESVVFKVVVSGKPLPTLTWYHGDIEVVNNYAQEVLDDGSLNLPSVECKQAGVYTLVAANDGGRVEQQVKLSVQFEGEKTPEVERKSMTLEAVPVPRFGECVVMNHNNNNQGFRDQFLVCIGLQCICMQLRFRQLFLFILLLPFLCFPLLSLSSSTGS